MKRQAAPSVANLARRGRAAFFVGSAFVVVALALSVAANVGDLSIVVATALLLIGAIALWALKSAAEVDIRTQRFAATLRAQEVLSDDFRRVRQDLQSTRTTLETLRSAQDSHQRVVHSTRADLQALQARLEGVQVDLEAHRESTSERFGDIRPKLYRAMQAAEGEGRSDKSSDPTTAGKWADLAGDGVDALLVNTIPKSGTYLVGSLLTKLGANDSGLHFREHWYWDFWDQPSSEVVRDPTQFRRLEPLHRSVRLLGRGQFAVAHLEQPSTSLPVLQRARIGTIFLVRNLRDCLISMMRFVEDPRRTDTTFPWSLTDEPSTRFLEYLQWGAAGYLKGVEAQLAWLRTDTPTLSFEDLAGDHGEPAQTEAVGELLAAADLRDVAVERAVQILRTDVLGQPNRTFSGGRSDFDEYRSDEVDHELARLGVPALNRMLGY